MINKNIIIHKLNLISRSKEVDTKEEIFHKNTTYEELLEAAKKG